MTEIPHIPVLLEPVLEDFASIDEGVIIDCTLGYAGHSSALLERKKRIKVIGIDRDQTAIDFATHRLQAFGERFTALKGDFASTFLEAVRQAGKENIKGVLADIGVSSLQLDQRDRGFGFESDVLDMRMDQTAELTAKEVVNSYSQERLAFIFKEYGELPHAVKLAQAVVKARSIKPFESAKELSAIAMQFKNFKKIHPATLMFQAIRIEVNDELGQLNAVLDAIEQAEFDTTIVSIISFHSLEDRIVKQRFKAWSSSCICPENAMRCVCGNDHARGKELHRKPKIADNSELKINPRSRSAKLRSFQFGTRTAF